MKKIILLLFCAFAAFHAVAADILVIPDDVKVERADRNLAVGMTINLAEIPVKSNMSVSVMPVLTSQDGERYELPPVTIAGRSRYYTLKREDNALASSSRFYKYSKNIKPLNYAAMIPYSPWMKNAILSVETSVEGCCSDNLGTTAYTLREIKLDKQAFEAEYVFATPAAEAVKIRAIQGKAFVDFKVNQTDILPDFGHNPGELAKIRESIDEIRDNDDTKIISLSITGYASPEGPYANNLRLAKGRTEALADYVKALYSFPAGFIMTSWVAEDWEGVSRFLNDNPSFEHRDAILSIVNSAIQPDAMNDRIKAEFPAAYRYMLENLYPSLRRSDYRVEYEVRSYSTVEEIAEVFRTRPGNLSLQELFVLGTSLPEDSDEYSDVFETAVRLYPYSEEAALNAALVGMKRGDYVGAGRHLEHAGDSPEAVYARGLLAVYQGDYAQARKYLDEAATLGVTQAENALINLSIFEQE